MRFVILNLSFIALICLSPLAVEANINPIYYCAATCFVCWLSNVVNAETMDTENKKKEGK